MNFFDAIRQRIFLNIFIFGNPEILKMILVSRLKRILKKIGNEVINCTIKKSGLCFFINLRRGKNENINIIIKVNLLFKNPPWGKNL